MFDIFRRTLLVTRQPLLVKNKGIWEEVGNPDIFFIKASVQEVKTELMQTLPEGYRTTQSRVLYTSSQLRVAKAGEYNADLIEIDDITYQVVYIIKNYNIKNFCTNHYKIIVIKLNVDGVDLI